MPRHARFLPLSARGPPASPADIDAAMILRNFTDEMRELVWQETSTGIAYEA